MKKRKLSNLTFLLSILLFQIYCAGNLFAENKSAKNLIYQKGNEFRPTILLNGKWQLKIEKKSILRKVEVPGICDYQEEVVFHRSFFIDSSLANYHFRLICYAINNYAEIFINNKFVGSHNGSYNSFYLDIPQNYIFPGKENQIEIKVDTRLDNRNTLPIRYQFDGLQYFGGIIRDIFLLALPKFTLIPEIDYTLNSDFSQCDLSVTLSIQSWDQDIVLSPIVNKAIPNLSYYIEVTELSTREKLIRQFGKFATNDELAYLPITEKFIIKVPKLWSPQKPNRYFISIRLFAGKKQIDKINRFIAFRQLDFFNGKIFLNGEEYFLRGINWSENYGKNRITFDYDVAVEKLITVKSLNANAVRIPYFPPHPWIPALCDSLGLFLLEELPLYGIPPNLLNSDIFTSFLRDYLCEFTERDEQWASLFGIGVGTGYFAQKNSNTFIEKIYPLISESSKIHFYFTAMPPAIKNPYFPETIAGISLLHKSPQEMKKLIAEWQRQRLKAPSIVISFGAPRYKLNAAEVDSVFYVKYRSAQIVQAYQIIRSFPEIDGCFLTSLTDFRGNYASTLPGDIRDPYLKPFGIVDETTKEPRFSFKAVRDLYTKGTSAYNPGLTLPVDKINIFMLTGILLIFAFSFIFHNRKYFRENLRRSFLHPHGFYTDIKDGRKIPASHTMMVAFFASASLSLLFSSFVYHLRANIFFDHLLTLIFFPPQIKALVAKHINHPEILLLFFTLAIIIYFLLFAVVFRLVLFFLRRRARIGRMISLSFWLGNIFVLLLPVGMISFRLITLQRLNGFVLFICFAFFVWYVIRSITGLRVIFMMPFLKMAIIFLLVISLLLLSFIYFLQTQSGFWNYALYYWCTFKHSLPLF